MRLSISIWCSLLLIAAFFNTNGQKYIYTHYTTADGLPTNEIYNSYCDKDGFMWFGSNRGLIKFDGKNFTTFDTEDGLPDNDVLGIVEDYEGRMWLNTFKGKLCYYKNGIFHTEKNTPFLKTAFTLSTFHSIVLNKDSSLTITDQSNYGSFIEIKGEKIKQNRINLTDDLKNISYRSTVFKTKVGYNIYNYDYQITCDHDLNILQKVKTKKDIIGEYPNIYFISKTGLENFKNETLIETRGLSLQNSPSLNIRSIFQVDSLILITTRKHLIVYDQRNRSSDTTLYNIELGFILRDKDSNIWISSTKNGIYKFNKGFHNNSRSTSSLDKSSFLFEKNKILHIAQENGCIFQYSNAKIKKVFTLPYTDSGTFYEPSMYVKNENKLGAITSTRYFEILINQNGKFSITLNSLLDNEHTFRQYFTVIENRIFRLVSADYYVSKRLKNGMIANKLRFRLPAKINDITNMGSKAIVALRDGLYYNKNDSFYKYKLSSDSIFSKITAIKNRLLGINASGDIVIINNLEEKPTSQTLHYKNLFFESILFSNDSICIVSAIKGCVYIILENKINRLAPKPKVFLVKSYINNGDIYKAYQTANFTYFIRKDDLLEISNDELIEKGKIPRPVLSYANTQHKIFYQNNFAIPHSKASNLEIHFSCLQTNYRSLYFQYATIYNGDTSAWFETNQTSISFSKPSYGKYCILVRSVNLLDQKSEPLLIQFQIQTPFYASTWFILLCLATLAIAGRLFYLYNLRKSIKKKDDEYRQEIKIRQSEFKALNALINPHFVFNSLNNIQSLINTNEKVNANKYLTIFSNLMRQNMYNVDSGMISLQKELELIGNYIEMEKLRHGDFFEFSYSTSGQVDPELIQIPPLTIQPIIENAIIHGLSPLKNKRPGKLTITVYEENKQIVIKIVDNGTGNTLKKKKENKSYGLNNIQSRLEHISFIHNKKFDIDVIHSNIGTEVLLTISEI